MARCVFIVQGEGRGHISQATALGEYLKDAGHTVEAVYVGCTPRSRMPACIREVFRGKCRCFYSPHLLRAPNGKGINLTRTITHNLARSVIYLSEARRLRKEIGELEPDLVFNFYDVVGGLAMRRIDPGIKRMGIGHHFFHHLEGYRCGGGPVWHKWLLKLHTRIILGGCDLAVALSFREVEGSGKIRVAPPLIRHAFRTIIHEPGERFLVYLLHEGFMYDLVEIAREDPAFRADIFSERRPEMELPPGLVHFRPDGQQFLQKLARCRGLITTAGFDTVSEAAYHGIPVAVVPSRNHFEQRCNAADVERSGLGIAVRVLVPGLAGQMKRGGHPGFRQWADRAGPIMARAINGY